MPFDAGQKSPGAVVRPRAGEVDPHLGPAAAGIPVGRAEGSGERQHGVIVGVGFAAQAL